MKLKPFRIAVQAVMFLLFVLFLFLAKYPLRDGLPYPLFLRLDPLIGITAMIAARTVIAVTAAGMVLLALTAVIGRYFCAWICPLGTTIDIFDRLAASKYRKKKNQRDGRFRQVKYYVLAAVLASAVFGVNMVFWFDPIAIVTRVYTVTVIPFVNMLAGLGLGVFRAMAAGLDVESDLLYASVRDYYYAGTFSTLFIFALILAGSLYQSRFWCRNVCPLGALLGLVSRFAVFKRVAEAGCTSCSRCRIICPMNAIEADCKTTITPECTLCGNCGSDCGSQGIAFTPAPFNRPDHVTGVSMSRRGFVQTAGLAAAGAVAAHTGLHGKTADAAVVRPPGALPEPDFLNRCVRCGECMKACRGNCLQPALLETGLSGMFSPRGVFQSGGCDPDCNNCGQVCPTAAIRPLPLEEKQFAKMGTAVIDRSRCIAWERQQLCLMCDEACPYNAITARVVDEHGAGVQKMPFVTEDACVGCGMCEAACPVAGTAAIRVYADGEERMAAGSYVTPRKKALRTPASSSGEGKAGFLGGEDDAPSGFLPAADDAPAGFLPDD